MRKLNYLAAAVGLLAAGFIAGNLSAQRNAQLTPPTVQADASSSVAGQSQAAKAKLTDANFHGRWATRPERISLTITGSNPLKVQLKSVVETQTREGELRGWLQPDGTVHCYIADSLQNMELHLKMQDDALLLSWPMGGSMFMLARVTQP
jgi:hypothetical protein